MQRQSGCKGSYDTSIDEIPGCERAARERNALAVDGGIDQHAGAIHDRAVRQIGTVDAGRVEPPPPVLAPIEMQEGKFQDVARLMQAGLFHQLGAAHRKQLLAAQALDVQPGPVAVAVPHRQIDLLACKVDMMHGGGNPQVDVGMRLGKPPQPMHQPLGGKVRGGADRQGARALALDQALGSDRDPVERVADDDQIVATRFGDHQPLALAIEQLDAELLLQRLHLMADGALRHAQFLGGARKTLVAGRRLEGLQGIQSRQTAQHRPTS